jgi:hypothetical protein
MSKIYGNKPHDCFERLPQRTIKQRLAYALVKRLGEWITTEDLIDVAYELGEGPLGAKESLKAHIHDLRGDLDGFIIEGDRYKGRRLMVRACPEPVEGRERSEPRTMRAKPACPEPPHPEPSSRALVEGAKRDEGRRACPERPHGEPSW